LARVGLPVTGAHIVGSIVDKMYSRIKSRYRNAKEWSYEADEVIVASRFLAELFKSNGWDRDIRIIPHSIDYSNVKRIRSEPSSTTTFSFIGSIAFHKGVHVLIEAFRKVPNSNIRLKIFGASARDQLEYFRMVETQAKGDDRIEFMGTFKIDELPEIMKDTSIMVIPSTYYENYPLVLLISLAYNVPAIVSNIGGMPELIKENLNGFLFEMGNYEALANVIKRIAEKPRILDEMKKNIVKPGRNEEEAMSYENIYGKVARAKTFPSKRE
jgi:glycosyltransferase involved in cell wall biosynthesis